MPIHDTPTSGTSNAVVIERVENLRCDVAEIKTTLADYIRESRERDEKRERELIIIGHKVETAHARIDSLDKFKGDVEKLLPFLRGYAWVLGAIAVPMLSWFVYLAVEWIRSAP